MNSTELKPAYDRSGLALIGISFESALASKAIRIALECATRAHNKGKSAPFQPALI